MDECKTCKRYIKSLLKGTILSCYNAQYFTPGSIVYCRPQMIWGISCIEDLRKGDWGSNPDSSNYTDTFTTNRTNSQAKFITAVEFYSEITARLETVSPDPKEALIHEIQSGLTEYILLSPPARRALNYISGWRRRRQSFREWVRQNKYRGKYELERLNNTR